jgi:cell division protein FtsQ
MAVNRRPLAGRERRVSLTRSGGAARPNLNIRRETTPRRHVAIPWDGVKGFFATGGIVAILFLFMAGVGFGLACAYRSLVSGSYFALKTMEIRGNSRLTSKEILEIVDLKDGANILALSIDAVEEALAKNLWVEEVSVKRVLPGTMIIDLREKSPAFWVLHQGILQYADARGRIIGPVIPGKFASLPTLEVEAEAEEAMVALPDLVKSLDESQLPLNLGAVSLVRLSAARGVEVYIEDERLKISIGLEEWLPNLQRLGRTLADLVRRGELKEIREIRAQGSNVWVERRARG